LQTIPGQAPTLSDRPTGCGFSPRCPHVEDSCRASIPTLEPVSEGHHVRCRRSRELDLAAEVMS
ncbi:MAG: dipeptide ABC transporter ATP-binding protein DppD, partial [Gemmatimonadota bacterium]|nr:dipeptide ABC transporter ATP-binding protein DppD [Gemmatimonadota bacterium]